MKSTWFNPSYHLILPFTLNLLCRFCNKPIIILSFNNRSELLLEIDYSPWNVDMHSAGDPGSIPGSERSPGEGKGYPLQYSGLETPTDCIVLVFTKSWETKLKGNKMAELIEAKIGYPLDIRYVSIDY